MIITFGFAVPILAALGVVRVWRWLERRRVLAVVVTAAIVLALLAGSAIAWNRQEPFLSGDEVSAATLAGEEASLTAARRPLVFLVNQRDGTGSFLATRAGNVIRASVPPDRIRDVLRVDRFAWRWFDDVEVDDVRRVHRRERDGGSLGWAAQLRRCLLRSVGQCGFVERRLELDRDGPAEPGTQLVQQCNPQQAAAAFPGVLHRCGNVEAGPESCAIRPERLLVGPDLHRVGQPSLRAIRHDNLQRRWVEPANRDAIDVHAGEDLTGMAVPQQCHDSRDSAVQDHHAGERRERQTDPGVHPPPADVHGH